MKKLVLVFAVILTANLLIGQTTATNFNVANCNGEMYNLFDDLDAGKVVVINWIMPCGPCISPTVSTYVATQAYDQEKVKFLLVDDYANTNCAQLQTWASDYQMNGVNIFSNSQIKMSDYGSDGMPKAVVVGCNSHKVYFNRNFDENNSTDGLSDAIDLALSDCGKVGIETTTANRSIQIYPNPANSSLTISSEKSNYISFAVVNMLGEIVLEKDNFESGAQIDISHLPQSNYVVKIKDEPGRFVFSKLN